MFAKKNLIAVAALATLAVSAQAQSSVTLYGNVDAGLTYSKTKVEGAGSSSKTGVDSSILTESFFGLKGQEDLGGGLKAIFKLESGINVDTGSQATSNFFGKNAYVGLAGDFGTVKLGNQESLFKNEAAAFDAFGSSPLLAVSNTLFLASGLGGSWQNTVGYTSPNLNGLTLSAQHSAKESGRAGPVTVGAGADGILGTADDDKVAGYNGGATAVAANYTAGALGLSAVYGEVRSTNASAAEVRQRAWLLGASYDFGVVKAFAQYGQDKEEQKSGDEWKAKYFQLGAVVPVTQNGAVHASYGQTKVDSEKARQFSLAYHHGLSKRTSVYAGVTYIKDEELLNDDGDTTKTTAVAVGLRHAF